MARRRDTWRRRWQWCAVVAIVSLLLYTTAANVWLLRPVSCPQPSVQTHTSPPVDTQSEPCDEIATQEPGDWDPLSRLDLRLGRWDGSHSYRMFDYAAVGERYAEISRERRACLATQTSMERLPELLRAAAHWSGPISVAVLVAGEELRSLRNFLSWLGHCHPDTTSRIALHLATPADEPARPISTPMRPPNCSTPPIVSHLASRARRPYPQNHLRNLARRNCQTGYVFLVDVDIVPSYGMSEALEDFLDTTPLCQLCAYVVPTYELDRRVASFPANKSELLRLSHNKLAVPFHRKVFIYNQYASNFSRWEASGGNESSRTHVSHNVTNFELLYEPFYVATDTVPPHDERFLGYGFTRNSQLGGRRIPRMMMEARVPVVPHWLCRLSYGDALTNNMFCGGHFLIGGVSSCQVYEMFLMGYQFRVLSPIFTIHWGLQARRTRPLWREKQNEKNRKYFETFKRELFARYRRDPLHLLRRSQQNGPQKKS